MNYSQNKEQEIIANFFSDFKGTLIDIGANDGKTFSNSLALINNGWKAVLIEPSTVAFKKLDELHSDNINVSCYKCAIGNENGKAQLKVSGHHLNDKSDVALLSSLNEDETIKWRNAGVSFEEEEVVVNTYAQLCKISGNKNFDFITIDCEGLDFDVLRQIDLSNTRLLCIEWNSIPQNKTDILNYCFKFGMDKVIYESGENLIICRG
jgi:FkbM family methyltransferase